MEKNCWFIFLAYLTLIEGDNPGVITKENATNFIEDSFFDPAIVKARDKPMYVSYLKVNADLVIRMVSEAIAKDRKNACEISVTIPRDYESTRPTAEILGNKKLIVGFVERRSDIINPHSTARFFIVDWDNKCASNNFSIPFSDEIIRTDKPFQIVPYNDSFDLFTKSKLLCKPPSYICAIRYKSKGKRTSVRQLGFLSDREEMHSLRLLPLWEHEDRGYVLVSLGRNLLMRLGREMRLLRELQLSERLVEQWVRGGRVSLRTREEAAPQQEHRLELDPSAGSSGLEVLSNRTLGDPEGFQRLREVELPGAGSVILSRGREIAERRVLLRLSRADKESGELSSAHSDFLVRCPAFPAAENFRLLCFEEEVCCWSVRCPEGRLTHCTRAPEPLR